MDRSLVCENMFAFIHILMFQLILILPSQSLNGDNTATPKAYRFYKPGFSLCFTLHLSLPTSLSLSLIEHKNTTGRNPNPVNVNDQVYWCILIASVLGLFYDFLSAEQMCNVLHLLNDCSICLHKDLGKRVANLSLKAQHCRLGWATGFGSVERESESPAVTAVDAAIQKANIHVHVSHNKDNADPYQSIKLCSC